MQRLLVSLALSLGLSLATPARGQGCELALVPSGTNGVVAQSIATDGPWLVMSGNHDIVVYEKLGGEWVQRQTLPLAAGFTNEYHLALSGDRMAVSTIGEPLRTFSLQAGSWVQTGALVDPLGHPHFGWDVAMDGDWMAVGVPGALRVELFHHQSGAWSHAQSIHEPAAVWHFGLPVELDSGRLAVGEQQLHDLRGAVYTYRLSSGAWIPTGRLRHLASEPDDRFGASIAYDGERILVGARGRSNSAGAVFAFEESAGGWRFLQELVGDPFPDAIGHDLAVAGGHLAVGAPFNDFVLPGVGSVLLFERTLQGYERVGHLYQQDLRSNGAFGLTVVANGDELFVRGPESTALAAFFRLDLGCLLNGAVRAFCACSPGGVCGNAGSPGTGCANSTGAGGSLSVASGSLSASADDLVLRASGLPPGSYGVVFLGELDGSRFTFGGGELCIGAPHCRLPVRSVDASGALVEGPGLRANAPADCVHGPIMFFRTFGVQCWYRDPTGPCGAPFNVTNGLEVSLTL